MRSGGLCYGIAFPGCTGSHIPCGGVFRTGNHQLVPPVCSRQGCTCQLVQRVSGSAQHTHFVVSARVCLVGVRCPNYHLLQVCSLPGAPRGNHPLLEDTNSASGTIQTSHPQFVMQITLAANVVIGHCRACMPERLVLCGLLEAPTPWMVHTTATQHDAFCRWYLLIALVTHT